MTTKTTATMTRTVSVFGPLQIAITILVAATALVHLFLGASLTMAGISGPLDAILAVLFLCNFGGYVVLNTALYLPALRDYQGITRAVLMGYTALTFVAYFAIVRSNALNPFGLADKAIEAAIIALLIVEGRRASRMTHTAG